LCDTCADTIWAAKVSSSGLNGAVAIGFLWRAREAARTTPR
jgi:hypothetical protein